MRPIAITVPLLAAGWGRVGAQAAGRHPRDREPGGHRMGLAVVSLMVMPLLIQAKQRGAARLDSRELACPRAQMMAPVAGPSLRLRPQRAVDRPKVGIGASAPPDGCCGRARTCGSPTSTWYRPSTAAGRRTRSSRMDGGNKLDRQ